MQGNTLTIPSYARTNTTFINHRIVLLSKSFCGAKRKGEMFYEQKKASSLYVYSGNAMTVIFYTAVVYITALI